MKSILLLFCLSLVSLSVTSQPFSKGSIEQRKKELPFLTGQEKLDCLTSITLSYFASSYAADSASVYAQWAIGEALLSGDKEKLFAIVNDFARLALQSARADEGMKYYRLAATVAQELNDDRMKAIAYRGIGQALWYQGNFQKAIDTIKLSIIYFQRENSIGHVSDAKMVISNIYGDQGDYEEAFEASLEALRLSRNIGDRDNTVLSLTQLGDLYRNIGDYSTALDYYRRGLSHSVDKDGWSYRHLCNGIGDLYCDLKKFDTAFKYYSAGLKGHAESKTSRLRLAEYYLLLNDYNTSLRYFTGLYNQLKNTGEGNILIYAMLGIGKIHYSKKNLPIAKDFANNALQAAKQRGTKQIIRDASKLLSSIYEETKQTDSALFYFKEYVQMKDSMVTDQFKGKLYAHRRTSVVDKKLQQIETLKKQRAANVRFTKVLVAVIISLGLLVLILFRNSKLRRKNQKLETERMEAEWQRRSGELEMQALRAQMNPHFIFNCLSSINKFILKNEADKASDYLTRFSRLIRLVLINSQKPLITLEDELEMLRLYIEMEKLRFKNSFDYTISYSHNIEPSNISIPPLLLQPFCENAIWHGLMHKEGSGHLDITFFMHDGMVACTITDNGIGREKASEIKTKSAERIKSLGLKLTSERLALFNEGKHVETFYKMEDVIEDGVVSGTRVKINIKHKEDLEETVEKV